MKKLIALLIMSLMITGCAITQRAGESDEDFQARRIATRQRRAAAAQAGLNGFNQGYNQNKPVMCTGTSAYGYITTTCY